MSREAMRETMMSDVGTGRSIQIALACALALTPSSVRSQAAPATHGWTPVFDGKSLSGWSAVGGYSVQNGAIVGDSLARRPICTEKSYEDIVVRMKARVSPRASGAAVLVRAPMSGSTAAGLGVPMTPGEWGNVTNPAGRVLSRGDAEARGHLRDTTEWADHVI